MRGNKHLPRVTTTLNKKAAKQFCLRRVKKRLWLVDQHDRLLPNRRGKKYASKAPHSVALRLELGKFLKPLHVTQAYSVLAWH
jgi:hypothetical protein